MINTGSSIIIRNPADPLIVPGLIVIYSSLRRTSHASSARSGCQKLNPDLSIRMNIRHPKKKHSGIFLEACSLWPAELVAYKSPIMRTPSWTSPTPRIQLRSLTGAKSSTSHCQEIPGHFLLKENIGRQQISLIALFLP